MKNKIPATVHVAIGTDIIHQHSSCRRRGYVITGHHEINILLLAAMVHEEMAGAGVHGDGV